MPSNFYGCFKHERAAAQIVPKLLKQCRLEIAQVMMTMFNDDPDLLKKVITGVESWLYGYDIETKAQSCQCKRPEEPRLKKPHEVRSNVKVMLTVFLDCNGMVHHEFLRQGRMANKENYIHTYIIGHSVRIIDLVSHTTYVVCVNFMLIHNWRNLLFKVDSERQIFLGNF